MPAAGGGGFPGGSGGSPGGGFSGASIGRISGPLLKDNLLRNGVDLSFETDLLYLDVNTTKIGIKTDSASRELEIVTHGQTTNLIVDDLIRVADLEVNDTSEISSLLDPIYLNAGTSIHANALKVDDLKFNNNRIETTITDSHLELRPTKGLVINSNTYVDATVHATGNVTFDGDITFGSDDADSVTFNSDIASNLTPDLTNTYTLGSDSKKWNTLYAEAIRGANIVVSTLSSPANITFSLRFSNTIFVAINGSNSNQGDHLNAPYRNINYALSQATAGDTVYIFPGTYSEIFPLTVPAGVTVVGYDIRHTIIQPTELTKFNDAFLLNGECYVSDLTVRNFFYDEDNNTGHAFRFAPGFTVTSRSPYIQNITVITSGSVTSEIDPKGFLSGDAGRGAYIDGSVANASSKEASMLFNSCTFLTPGVDCVTMTNGVRVEWLNCFTYFANRGLYAINGYLGFASLGVKYGAELRSIGSANVYGTYGAVADGSATLMYLVNHNFGYVGSGSDSSNDNTLAVQDNEVVELNAGKIYYTSQAQDGDFRVGNQFFVDLANGVVSFDTSGVASNGLSSIRINGTNSKLFLDANKIELGDFRLSGNTIETLSQTFNIQSADTNINFTRNVTASKNIILSGDFQTDGTITLGNQASDTVTIATNLSQDLNPKVTNSYDIGSLTPTSKIWRDIYLAGIITQDVKFSNSIIQTTVTDSNLLFSGAGTGLVKVETLLFGSNSIASTTTNSNIKITPKPLYGLTVPGSLAVRIPRATTALTTTGELRFNSATGLFDGYSSSLIGLGGVMSADRQSSVYPHLTNDTLNFKVNDIVTTTLTSTGLTTNAWYINNLQINANTLSTTSNSDLTLVADAVSIQSLTVQDNDIVSSLDQNLEIKTTGLGFVQFTGDKAIQIPSGDDLSRPTAPLLGNTRFNIEREYLEVWDGAAWIPATGVGELSTFEYANEQTTLWSLVLG